ncbi:MAG: hypothetical protein V4505_13830 [Pseudomonadota bacterium]
MTMQARRTTAARLRIVFFLLVLAGAAFHGWRAYATGPGVAGVEGLVPGAIAYAPLALAAVLGLLRRQAAIAAWNWWLVLAVYIASGLSLVVGATMAGTLVAMANTVLPLALLASVALTPAEQQGQWN